MDGETVDVGLETADTEVQGTETEGSEQGLEQGAEEVQPQTTQEGQESGEEGRVDGRRGPSNIRSSIKAAAEALPEQAAAFKELGNAYFRDQSYRQAFKTPQEAVSAKALLDGIGGVEGASSMQERVQAYDTQETAIQAGDPSVLDSFFKDYPQQAAGMASAFLERVSQVNPTALNEAVGPYAVEMVINAGFAETLRDAFNADDPKPIIEKMYNWLAQQDQSAKNLRANGGTKASGATDRLAQEREQLHQEKEQIFQTSVAERVNSIVDPQIASQVDRYAKQYKLNDTQKTHFRETLQQAVVKAMNDDATYKKQVDIRYANKSRSRESVATYIAGEFNRRMNDKALEVIRGIYGSPRVSSSAQAGQIKAGQPQTAPGGGPLRVNYIPSNDQLDTSRPDFQMLRIKGQGYLKGSGRFVTWSHLRG